MGRLEPVQTDTLFNLGRERLGWLELRRRVGRTAGLDSQLKGQYEVSNDRMNTLLETYHQLLQGAVILDLPTTPGFYGTEVPIKHTGEVYEIDGA